MLDNPVIVILGNIVDGVNHIGPFDEWEDATNWAEAFSNGVQFVVTELSPPEDNESNVSEWEN